MNKNTQNTEVIEAKTEAAQYKHFIIGKMWAKSRDGKRPGTMKISSNLPNRIVLHPGCTLFLNENNQREGKQDPDYTVSIKLPINLADALIEKQRTTKSYAQA